MIVVGLMSGTSADGVDAAVVRLEGCPPHLRWALLGHTHVPYEEELRREVFAAFRPETGRVDRLCALNFALGRAFAQAALRAIAEAGLTPSQVSLIGSHGQTVWHIPTGPQASTFQLGEAAVIAELTGIPVVSNFRTRDMAAGGQGAPLVAYVDVLLLTQPGRVRAAQNIGGIANVTYLPPAEAEGEGAFAFDTGPGNMLIDAMAVRATEGAWLYDHDGQLAARGRVDEALLARLMGEAYLHRPPPKTTGRELFGEPFAGRVWAEAMARGLAPADVVATVTAFTAASIAQAYRDFLPRFPDEVIVSGGGARNPTLMAMLRARLAPARLLTSDALGIPVEAKEALAFAVLAYETWHGRAGTLPAATGAAHAVVVGDVTPGPPSAPPAPADAGGVPLTEARNPATAQIDVVPTPEMVRLMHAEDAKVAPAVACELPQIAEAIDGIAARMRRGGRLIYIGAGTSGRLGVLDAAECPPTFNAAPDQVVALIAGGADALTRAMEGAEDDREAGARDVAALGVTARDSVVGISAGGRTPYVLGGLEEARRRGAFTVSLACNRPAPVQEVAQVNIAPLVGPEVIAGSTRLKAGTAQKMVLNMLSTGVMIRLGKTYGHWMVDVQATNAKLRARARRIVAEVTGVSAEEAARVLAACDGEVKTAIVALLAGVTPTEARQRLAAADGMVRRALQGAG